MKHIIASVLLVLSFGSRALAATITASQSGNWSAAATWGGHAAPTIGDAVIINGGFAVTVDIPDAACSSLQLGGTLSNTGQGTALFTGDSKLAVSGLVTVGASNNAGSITMATGGTLACEGFIMNSLGTWTPGTGTVVLTASNTLPNNGITSFNNLTAGGGTTTLDANLTVTGDLVINPAAAIDCGVRTLSLAGNWINDGTFTGNTGLVIFDRNGNQSISGTGINNFNLIRVNMGTSNTNTLEVLSTHFSAPDAFLTLSNGTFKISGSFTFASTFITGPLYNIQPSAGLWINNPNVTVTAQAGGVSVRGVLRLSAGTYNIGTSPDNNLDYVAGSSIIIEGGALNIAGHLGRNSPASTTSYTQTGGVVTVVTQGSTDLTNAGFDLGTAGSSFTVSGGSIVVANATSNATDYMNIAGTSAVTGGTVQLGNAGTLNAQTIRFRSSVPVGNLLVSDASAQPAKPAVQLVTSSLHVLGNITLEAGTALNADGLNVSLGGDWSDAGTFTAGPLVTFNGSGAQSLTAPGGETFSGFTIDKAGGSVALNDSLTVNGSFTLTQGTLAVGASLLRLNSSASGGGTLTSGSAGTVRYNQGSAGQTVLGGTYGNLVFSDFDKILPSAATVAIAGTFDPGAATGHTVTGSTLNFDGGSQNIPAFTYNNLTLSGSGTKTGTGLLTVNGSLTNGAGISFTGTTNLTLNGTTHTNNGTLDASAVTVGPGATLTNNGDLSAAAALTGTGTLTQGTTGVLTLGGVVDIATLNASTAGNTVVYTGAGQTVRAAVYHHLTLSGSGAASLAGTGTINGNFTLAGTVTAAAAEGITIGGSFSISAGASFDAGPYVHSLRGDLTAEGILNPASSTFILNGTTAQTISGVRFSSVTVDNTAGIAMAGDDTVAGTLTLTSGTISIGAHTLTLNGALVTGGGSIAGGPASDLVVGGPASVLTLPGLTLDNLTLNRTSGALLAGDITVNGLLTITSGTLATASHAVILGPAGTLTEPAGQPVLGTVTTSRTITGTSRTESFGNMGADIVVNGIAPGTTSVTRTTGVASTGGGHSSIKRYFDIVPSTNTGLNAGVVFHYDSSEVTGQNPGTLELYRSRDGGTTWSNLGGTVNTASRTITATGINDFSRWTASDTSNRIGITATPTLTDITPTVKHAGDAAFTLTVHGADFVNGKAGVLFNQQPRTTTFLSSTQLQASIPASDLLVAGIFPVTVVSPDGGPSNTLTLTVIPGAFTSVSVETAPDGSGTVVPAQSLSAGSAITVYAIVRDSLANFGANVAADAWSLQGVTGGVVSGDLVPSVDGRSAVFTAHAVGGAAIRATSGSLTAAASGILTVTPGAARKVRVETLADGSGSVVPAESLTAGTSITVFAVTRDSLDNFVENAAANSWSLENITGGVVSGDLVPASDRKSAVFTAHAGGTATIRATSGSLTSVGSGTITVGIIEGVTEGTRPLVYAMEQNYPNPFNPTTKITYQTADAGMVTLSVYDLLGREVAVLVNEQKAPGSYAVTFDAGGLASGTYIYRLQATREDGGRGGNFVQTKKLILLR